ncbi:hypothetical protein Bbelb_404220 [Branchiostoma belcheri]|nr:hypothetical protein Bbelb_404220 [Branchiostoma belcheri]
MTSFHTTASETRVETTDEGAKTTVTTVTTVRTSNTRTQSGESASESAATNRMSQEEIQHHIPEPLPEVPGIDFKQFDDVCDLADDMLREEDNPPVPIGEGELWARHWEDSRLTLRAKMAEQ